MHYLQITLPEFMLGLLSSAQYKHDPIVIGLISRIDEIIEGVMRYSEMGKRKVEDLANKITTKTYVDEVAQLARHDGGLHFNVSCTNIKQLEAFSIPELMQVMKQNAPSLWGMLDVVLSAHATEMSGTSGDDDANEQDLYWNALDGGDIRRGRRPTDRLDKQRAVATIKKVVIVSIMAQNKNQRANQLQSMLGVFLQSAHAPQKVIETLAHMGLSISLSSINSAIQSLSRESSNVIKELGHTRLASYAYDNFDVDMKTSDQHVEKSSDTLKHLTSAILFPLQHGTTTEDLRCSRVLWEQSIYNIQAREPAAQRAGKTYRDLLGLHERGLGADGMSSRRRYNTWKMLSDLIEYGPEYFRRFRNVLGEPEVVEAIPVVKTPIIAARSMEYMNSTVSGNINSVTGLLAQAGIHDPMQTHDPNMPDISDYVVLFHGDLGTGERIQALLQRRAMETSPWRRCQYVQFVPGLFHLKMAAADAIWRAFLQPVAARGDETSLLRDVAILRPMELGHYQSKPGFRRMHQLITYSGICRRLNCWLEEVAKNDPRIDSLDAFAAIEPTFSQLKGIAQALSRNYVATHAVINAHRRQPGPQRDVQHENALILNEYLLLYEELTHAMNSGDIGRVEMCIVAWILIFKATGKHKYATHMMDLLMNVHFVYPEGLRHAIRYSILVNPTGKKGKFRAVDWCVELNNLFTKVINGGKFSNHTIDRILLESPLVQVYRNLHENFQKHFLHTHLSSRKNEANMVKTFAELCAHLEKHRPHKIQLGRSSKYCISELIDEGHTLMEKVESELGRESEHQEDPDGESSDSLTLDDIVLELGL
ncbi:hypothetical protein L210DRAFT_3639881 [Boletus edulis BED1]|uniref:DUF6589 domain-containing protein n=1 Tax=Boletus edulis BED1 TaxID=1328754 RepID=A0AAD4GKP2_BOLED|nr:hypothetical protein L210DRAFT_3639881 [Boletus edulis BED1]